MSGVALAVEERGALGRAATITVDNPGKLNILDPARMSALEATLAELAADERLRSPGEVCGTQALPRIYRMNCERMDFRRPAPFEK